MPKGLFTNTGEIIAVNALVKGFNMPNKKFLPQKTPRKKTERGYNLLIINRKILN
jgi:hypothetical protein